MPNLNVGLGSAFALDMGMGMDCNETSVNITGGTRKTITNSGNCVACITYPCYQCTCNNGYSMRITNSENGYCDCSQCDRGYYGSGTTCTACPTATGLYTNAALTTLARGTSSAGTTSQSGCYLSTGTYYDATGTLSITAKCNY